MHAGESYRLSGSERDYRVAIGIVGDLGLHVAKAASVCKPDEIDRIGGSIEIVDYVIADQMIEHERIAPLRTGERVGPRPRKNR